MSKHTKRRTLSARHHACLILLTMAVLALPSATHGQNRNVLLLVADDLGIEYLDFYGIGDPDNYAHTPGLTGRVNRWLVFENAWSTPVCSPTRTTIMTGLYGFLNGIGAIIETEPGNNPDDLDLTRPDFLPKLFDGSNYHTAAFGKWHLGEAFFNGDDTPPIIAGFDHYSSALYQPQFGVFEPGELYFNFVRTTDTDTTPPVNVTLTGDYSTEDHIDEAMAWLDDLEDTAPGDPWFVYIPFFAPHAPFVCPPSNIYPEIGCVDNPADPNNLVEIYKDMIEAMDFEIERLLDWIEGSDYRDNTVVIFVSDNGSDSRVTNIPFDDERSKQTVFEGGVRVPLLIGDLRGPADPPIVNADVIGLEQGLVNTTDIYDTIVELTGRPEPTRPIWQDEQSQSLVPYFGAVKPAGSIRDCIYTERFKPNFRQGEPRPAPSPNERAIAGVTASSDEDVYKVVSVSGARALYNLSTDPTELINLLDPTHCSDTLCSAEQLIVSELLACADKFTENCILADAGEECSFNVDCCPGLFCEKPSPSATGTCAPFVP